MIMLIVAMLFLVLMAEFAYTAILNLLLWAPSVFLGVVVMQFMLAQHPNQPIQAMEAFALTAFALRFLMGRIRSLIVFGALF